MLIAVIPVKDYQNAKEKIDQAANQADGIELRLDYLQPFDISLIAKLRDQCKLPVIFTCRKQSQGGFYEQSETQRLQDILALCELNPDYFDLEYDVNPTDIKQRYSHIKLICSYHNFQETPQDLNAIFQAMQQPHFYSYKIATTANSSLDALRLCEWLKSMNNQHSITALAMGEDGQCTRILGPLFGSAMTYASLDENHATAPGQLTLDDLNKIYHFKNLNGETKIYALLGDPIHLSLGHLFHNQSIELLGENAVYVKLRVTQQELPSVIKKCRELPFHGFSLTMPLKETILPLLDEIEPSSQPIKAINSIVNNNNKYIGFNTDGMGAIQTLSAHVNLANQKIVILGAGGAARAIAYEALRQNAKVIILNRTIDKAKSLAQELGCEGYELNHIIQLKKTGYTILINTLPAKVFSENIELLNADNLLPNIFAMDIVYQPIHTPFLQIAPQANCQCIFGYEMFINQALLQIKRWFHPDEKMLDKIKNTMGEYFL